MVPNAIVVGRVLVLVMLFAAMCLANAAEKTKQSYVKTGFSTGYRTAVPIGDRANHEVGQELTIADIKYSNSDFKARSEWALTQFDYIDGTGKQRGIFIDTHEDGSQTYGTFEGSQRTITQADGTWESVWEGKYRYTGGTGEYKGIRGEGEYRGRASSKSVAREEGTEVLEY